MCGIVALRRLDGEPVQRETLERMAATLVHRGPDEGGLVRSACGRVGLAHRRLSIVDLQGGQQPMWDADTGVVITFNGEIYDDARWREELERLGHRFFTRSDTEVLLRAYLEHGEGCLERLEGEFAFVLWDPRRDLLVAARDALGVKPLYYAALPGLVAFGSEIKALLALPELPRGFAPRYFSATLAGVSDPEVSPLAAVRSVPPGGLVRVGAGGLAEVRRWWRAPLGAARFEGSYEEAVVAVRSALSTAVARRLRADVPVGVYLSGGLDSTAVLALMRAHGADPTAYHLSFPGSPVDERAIAERTASHFGARLEVVSCTPERLIDELEATLHHTEGVLVNLHTVAKRLLAQGVRAHGTKVCLTGEGSDESFAGYPHFKLEAIWRLMERQPAQARALLARFEDEEAATRNLIWSLPPGWRRRAGPYGFRSFFELHAANMQRTLGWMFRREALGEREEDRALVRLHALHPTSLALEPLDLSRRMSFDALATYVLPNLGDRVELAHGVECRTPFLDRAVVELACSLPESSLIDLPALRGKRVLSDAIAPWLPAHVAQRNKAAFVAPRWGVLRSHPRGRELVEEHLSWAAVREVGLLRPSFVMGLRALWSWLPAGGWWAERVDAGVGIVLTLQMLARQWQVRSAGPVAALTERGALG